jgi:hypothetical protein
VAEAIRSIEKKSISSGTRTGDLPASSVVPQPTTLPCAPHSDVSIYISESFLDPNVPNNNVMSETAGA